MKNASKKSSIMYMKYSAEPIVVLGLLLFAVLVLSLPYILRDSTVMFGDEAYYHLRIASLIQEKGIIKFDPLSYGGRPLLTPLGLPFILAKTSSLLNMGLEIISKTISFMIGILSVILFYFILKNLNIKKRIRIIAVLTFIISPLFIYLFSRSNYYFIPLFLNLLAFYLLLKNQKILTSIVLLLTPFFGIIHPIIGLLSILIYTLIKEKKLSIWHYVTSIIVLSITLIIYLPILLKFGIDKLPVHQQLLSDLGGKISLSIFALILSLIGIIVTWKKKHAYTALHISFAVLLLAAYFYNPVLIYLNILLAVLVSFGILKLIERGWESKFIKNFTILIFALGLIFSGLSYIKQASDSMPNEEIFESLSLIKSREQKTVFSHYSNGYWINSIAEKPNVMDPLFNYAPKLDEAYLDSQQLLYSRNLENDTKIIEKYNIGYIFITPEMKQGQVWTSDEEGLLFILKFSKEFKKIYDKKGFEIWEVNLED
ncbi:hypothetical protein J4414_04150 [Candidatus Woesearchaeota archaeon]|nr:hypothetical protein [Candidatus Woesearchaeota archaeon]